jgi:hypothetical protein
MPIPAITVLLIGAGALGNNPVLDKKVQTVLPTPQENRFLQIPWRANVLKAVVEAQKEKKPLFFWVMNGHPLGST